MKARPLLLSALVLILLVAVLGPALAQRALLSFTWRQEAEEGELLPPMAAGWDVGTSVCEYVYSPDGDGSVSFTIEVPADGDYYLWARVMGLADEGFAKGPDYPPDTRHSAALHRLQDQAMIAGAGGWAHYRR